MKIFLSFILVCAVMGIICACSTTTKVDNSTIEQFDLNRYLGKWYEIARMDHGFQSGMDNCTAYYSLNENGTIRVRNQGMKDGKQKESVGKAKVTATPGLLRVSFWGPFYSDYRVMMLDSDYQYALIGSGSSGYLWILARTPQLSEPIKQSILAEARRRGYDISQLIWNDFSNTNPYALWNNSTNSSNLPHSSL